MHLCQNIHLDMKKIDRYVKHILIYINTYDRYIWSEKESKI